MAPAENDKKFQFWVVSKCGVGEKDIGDYVFTTQKRGKENQSKISF